MDARLVELFGGSYQMNEDRQKIWDQYSREKNGPMRRMFLDYNRYHEAGKIYDELRDRNVNFKADHQFMVLDYGCGVADYGIYFARLGSFVRLLDIDNEALQFAMWRFSNEGLDYGVTDGIYSKYDMVVFGEVLDHLEDPFSVLWQAVKLDVKYIFTSSYPYRSDSPDDVHWKHDHHPATAREQQKLCRDLLERDYEKLLITGGAGYLWIKK